MSQGGDFSFLNVGAKECKTTLMNKTVDLPEGSVKSFSAGLHFAERCQSPSWLLPFSTGL